MIRLLLYSSKNFNHLGIDPFLVVFFHNVIGDLNDVIAKLSKESESSKNGFIIPNQFSTKGACFSLKLGDLDRGLSRKMKWYRSTGDTSF